MTLDRALTAALQTRGTKAVLLLNEVYVPIAGRGDLEESDVQDISRLLSWTDIDSTGRISFHDGTWLQFHHAETHTLVLVMKASAAGSPSITERHQEPSSSSSGVSTSVGMLRRKTLISNAEPCS